MKKISPKEVRTPHQVNDVSVMVIEAKIIEEQMAEMMNLLNIIVKDNEENNRKIDDLEKEIQKLRKEKDKSRHNTDEEEGDGGNPKNATYTEKRLQAIIASSIRNQLGEISSGASRYVKPYTKRIDSLCMPVGYQPPKFQQFDGNGNPRQHIVHFIETCNNAGTYGDLQVKQFVRSLKDTAFNWYTDLDPESIDSWDQMEVEFLNRFYSTRRIVSMSELTNTEQEEDEPVIDYINRWRSLTLECKDHLTEALAVEMCINGMKWELLYILKGIKPRRFQELATRAHDMEITITNNGEGEATPMSSDTDEFEEAMAIGVHKPMNNSTSRKGRKKKVSNSNAKVKTLRTLKEFKKKTYPFEETDLPAMLDR